VGGRRPDGFHDLAGIFAALDFGDSLLFEVVADTSDTSADVSGGEPGCAIRIDWKAGGTVRPAALPHEKNSVYRAVSLFRAWTGYRASLRISVEKRIPLGAGLGGGSSDAASALMALDALAGTGLSRAALLEMAAELGSDVPFFLTGGTALVSGRGERIRPIAAPRNIWVALVNPGFHSGTAEAFALLDAVRAQGTEEYSGEVGGSLEDMGAFLAGQPETWPFVNDFLPVLLARGGEAAAVYRDILGALQTLGAEFSGLTGTGSTCFGIFRSKGAAQQAVQTLLRRWNCTQMTFLLARSANAVLQ
jgi:4-diphosphocytidyl-2-C-methyl-D-erythritol kinase